MAAVHNHVHNWHSEEEVDQKRGWMKRSNAEVTHHLKDDMLVELQIHSALTGLRQEADGTWTFHRNWARLPREESTCPNWPGLSSSIESSEEDLEESIHDSTLESRAQIDEGA